MSNALVPAGGNALAAYAGSDPYSAAGRDMGGGKGQGHFLSYSGKTGRWSIKAGEVDPDQRFVFHPDDTQRGAICWVHGKVMGEEMVGITSGQVVPTAIEMERIQSYGPYRQVASDEQPDGWINQASIRLTHADTGEEYLFKTTSKSGLLAIANLLSEYGKKRMFNAGKAPVITNSTTQFKPKGKNYFVYAPSLRISEWLDPSQVVEAGGSEEDYQEYDQADQGHYVDQGQQQVEDAQFVMQPAAQQPVQQQAAAPVNRPAPPQPAAARPAPPAAGGVVAQRPAGPRPRNFG